MLTEAQKIAFNSAVDILTKLTIETKSSLVLVTSGKPDVTGEYIGLFDGQQMLSDLLPLPPIVYFDLDAESQNGNV
jgi:hypothetical protein